MHITYLIVLFAPFENDSKIIECNSLSDAPFWNADIYVHVHLLLDNINDFDILFACSCIGPLSKSSRIFVDKAGTKFARYALTVAIPFFVVDVVPPIPEIVSQGEPEPGSVFRFLV